MTKEDIKEIHRVFNEIVVTQLLDRETLFKTYRLINGVDTQNINLCRRCITSFVNNHPIKEDIKENNIIQDEKKVQESIGVKSSNDEISGIKTTSDGRKRNGNRTTGQKVPDNSNKNTRKGPKLR